jgi:predicted RNA-binding Zn ribbon-like protein
MQVHVQPMAVPDVVALVNGWGTRSRGVGGRETPAGTGRTARIAVADRLFEVFAAEPAERARLVTAMLDETAVRPELAEAGGSFVAGWTVPRRRSVLLSSAALALRDYLAAHPDRLGVCADRQCADVFADVSPAGHRRFCSPTCQTRTRVAAFRERRRHQARHPVDRSQMSTVETG